MSVWHLVFKEIFHRKLNFGLGLFSVAAAVGCLVGAVTLLQHHQARTDALIAAKMAQAKAQDQALKDQIRKITKKLGFNLLILPKNQNLHDVYAEGYASQTMPQAYAAKLANSKIVTINHLLPSLTQKLVWPEQKRTILLIGTRGEVPLMFRNPKQPIMDLIPAGQIILGYELWRQLGLRKGGRTTLLGRTFTIKECFPARGNKDDITAWINLKEAQALLHQEGRINAIKALECNCATVDRMGAIRREVAAILPNTQVVEFASEAVARAEARQAVRRKALAAIQDEKNYRGQLKGELETFAAVLVPLVLIGSVAWIAFLTFGNVRERRVEIGILRALGLGSREILLLFLSKALLMGLLGAAAGFCAGWIVGANWGGGGRGAAQESARLFDPGLLVLVLFLAPFLAGLASWIPAMLAAQKDPAVVLREE